MAVSRVFAGVLVMFTVVLALVPPRVEAQSMAPAPAPVSDGKLLLLCSCIFLLL